MRSMRAEKMTRLKMSIPEMSVPRKCDPLGDCLGLLDAVHQG
jgi:hypothetical protein